MYKLLCLDLDGTLLNKKHEISEENKKSIRLLNEKGVKVVLASGREPCSVKNYGEKLKIKEPLVGLNGGIITDHTGEKVFYEECLEEELAKEAICFSEQSNMCGVIVM